MTKYFCWRLSMLAMQRLEQPPDWQFLVAYQYMYIRLQLCDRLTFPVTDSVSWSVTLILTLTLHYIILHYRYCRWLFHPSEWLLLNANSLMFGCCGPILLLSWPFFIHAASGPFSCGRFFSGRYFCGRLFQLWTFFPWTYFPWTFFPTTMTWVSEWVDS